MDMISALEINKEIATILKGLNYKHYPLVIPEDTQMPVIVYNRTVDYSDDNSDTTIGVATIELEVLTGNYKEGIDILNKLYSSLLGKGYSPEGITEDFIDGVYIQKLVVSKYVLIN